MGGGSYYFLLMPSRMTEVYFGDTRRGYGQSVSSVFYKLKTTKYARVFEPAMEQFKGQGSCGNGSAMRISPAALYGFKDDRVLIEVCVECVVCACGGEAGGSVEGPCVMAWEIGKTGE